ncbi:hypothetical protein FRB90_006029, partial [Tulasnella sp. 427]
MTIDIDEIKKAEAAKARAAAAARRPSAILHRTPFVPPVAVSAEGINVELADGRRLIDGVGGAAVASIGMERISQVATAEINTAVLGMGNKRVIKAIKDQAEKMSYIYNAQCSNEAAEELAHLIIEQSKGAFELVGFVSGGSEAMEGVIKLARQYFYETNQPKRKNFIARNLSYHGNTIGTLELSHHLSRRAPYEAILDHEHFHHVSPAYAKRYKKPNETEDEYVNRLAQELDDKFKELGPDTVIGFVAETVVGATAGVVPPPKGYLKAMKR